MNPELRKGGDNRAPDSFGSKANPRCDVGFDFVEQNPPMSIGMNCQEDNKFGINHVL